jgi:hypothetical protein
MGLSANFTNYANYCRSLRHLDGFAVFKKAALQLSIRVIREIRGQKIKNSVSYFPS